jgi:hypothetical protein
VIADSISGGANSFLPLPLPKTAALANLVVCLRRKLVYNVLNLLIVQPNMLDALAAVRSRITDIDTQILGLERSLSALRTERALERETLDSYKYPVLIAVPTEIISEIFIQFLPIYPLCPLSTGILSPTVLTQICRKWREIALDTKESNHIAIRWATIMSHVAMLWESGHPMAVQP